MRSGPPGYTRMGTFWVPPRPEEPPPPPRHDPDLDRLDVATFKARLDAGFAHVCSRLDDATLSADARQYLSGMRHGLAEALRFLTVENRRPSLAEVLVHSEEPHV